jgi:hypothetical protein
MLFSFLYYFIALSVAQIIHIAFNEND